jgi:hypothetical protein
MSKFKTRQQLLDEITAERTKLEALLKQIPQDQKTVAVSDGMSVKDFLAHRTEWGKMVLSWYKEIKAGKTPHIPHQDYKWNQLKELNAVIFEQYKNTPLTTIERNFTRVHNQLYKLAETATEKELFEKFIGNHGLAAYLNSSTAAHYRSAYKHINAWWKKHNNQS